MFRFLHAADLHLDSPLRGLSRHDDAPVDEIRGATRRALVNLVDLALEQEVAFVLMAGDLYDGDQKDFATALFFNREMLRLREAGIPVIAIRGNHDAESVITKALTPPDNVTFLPVKKAGSYIVPGLPVAIHGQGFENAAAKENLVPGYPEAEEGQFNIGLLHTSLAGSALHDTYAPCSISDLEKKDYQYWALGHIHQPEVIQKDPWIVYSGNIQGRKINETGPRGCYLVEVDDELAIASHEFQTLDVVRWEHLAIDLSEIELPDLLRAEISKAFRTAFHEAVDRLLALRVSLTGVTPLHGELHAHLGRWQAECVSAAQEIDGSRVWFEQLKLGTRPKQNLEELAQRDDLTALVLAGLESLDPNEDLPAVASLEGKLPRSVLAELVEEESGDLKEEIAAIVLHGITTNPGEES